MGRNKSRLSFLLASRAAIVAAAALFALRVKLRHLTSSGRSLPAPSRRPPSPTVAKLGLGADEQTSWGALDDRAVCAIAESRSLLAERKRLMDELVLNCQHRREAARRAAQSLRKAEADLVANYRRWLPNGEAAQTDLEHWRSSAASPEYAQKAGAL